MGRKKTKDLSNKRDAELERQHAEDARIVEEERLRMQEQADEKARQQELAALLAAIPPGSEFDMTTILPIEVELPPMPELAPPPNDNLSAQMQAAYDEEVRRFEAERKRMQAEAEAKALQQQIDRMRDELPDEVEELIPVILPVELDFPPIPEFVPPPRSEHAKPAKENKNPPSQAERSANNNNNYDDFGWGGLTQDEQTIIYVGGGFTILLVLILISKK